MIPRVAQAPGRPGIPPRWTSSDKSGVGTALSAASRVWFTLGHGILDEVYYPRADQACTRDMGLIVTDGADFFSEEKRHTRHEVAFPAEGVPVYRLVNTCAQGRYRTEKTVLADPRSEVVLQHTRLTALRGALGDYRLYVLLAPHLGNRGGGNTAWVGDYKGAAMLFAQREACALALACSAPWKERSAGFVGVSDGWQDLVRHRRMTWAYDRAQDGNVALTGEVDLEACSGEFTLALGFGRNAAEAGLRALSSLQRGFGTAQSEYAGEWRSWQEALRPSAGPDGGGLYRVSAMVLRAHDSKRFPGGMIASLSVPWGFQKGDDDLGGYHLVWPRDLAEAAGGLLAVGALEDARRVLRYLQATQESDGHWPQNMWLDGSTYWQGQQMDETAFPVLLVDLALREGALEREDSAPLWTMVRRAVGFLVRNGPVTQEDRWEEDPGYSPFTLAVEISALLAAADLAEANDEPGTAVFLRETADIWNEGIERWTYVTGERARSQGVQGYYVRIAPPEEADASTPAEGFVPIKNRPPGKRDEPAAHIVSPDALALVRFGLRSADDPRIANTVRVIDALLRVDTPSGPLWHRYNEDGYGEHEDGAAFDGTGVGRGWPLLVGERAHYELAAGRRDEALRLLAALERFSGDGGLIPEQVWDASDLPERGLFFGRPSGSAMPLVWAHAEYVKLRRSLQDDKVFDTPPQTVRRYQVEKNTPLHAVWRFNHKCRTISRGRALRVEVLEPALVHWSADGWKSTQDVWTRDTGLGVHLVDLPTTELGPGTEIVFTFYWPAAERWEGTDFRVGLEAP